MHMITTFSNKISTSTMKPLALQAKEESANKAARLTSELKTARVSAKVTQ